ncbi:MAG: prepilin-type N-terminal cleavage/methylation domain-containing protein [Verrucomicrobia bacterium]|nr:prepilin-type N-terminal cleavage/methylation domain-containing protein [Verrucomicrobiota bacterium]
MRPLSQSDGYRPRPARGFTLVEILVATTIMGIMVTAVLGLFINMMKSYKYNTFRLSINRDVRTFTNELTDTATYANYYIILADFVTRTTGPAGSEVLAYMADGESGDCVLLVFKDDTDDAKIARIVGYYHDPDADGMGPVRKFDLRFSPTVTGTSLWTLLPSTSTLHTNADIISAGTIGRATGTSTSGRLFYNFFNRSVMVKGQINYISNDGLTRRAVSTYNFTVSPRG